MNLVLVVVEPTTANTNESAAPTAQSVRPPVMPVPETTYMYVCTVRTRVRQKRMMMMQHQLQASS